MAYRILMAQRWVQSRSGWARSGLAFGVGGLSVLSMAPFFLSPVLFVTLPVFFWLLDTCDAGESGLQHNQPEQQERSSLRTAKYAFRDGWWFGFGYFFFGLFWIGEAFLVEAEMFAWLLPIAITLLPAGLALFFGVASAAARLWWRSGWSRILVLAVALFITEWLRGHVLTGLPWNTLGYALTQPLALMQSASVFGVFGLTLWVVVIFAAPAVILADGLNRKEAGLKPFAGVIVSAVLLISAYVFGSLELQSAENKMVPDVRLRLVQPAIAQKDKWDPSKRQEIFDSLLSLSQTAPDGQLVGLQGVTHVIWPEAAVPFLILRSPEALRKIADVLPDTSHLMMGALRFSETVSADTPPEDREAFNSLMAFGGNGLLLGLVDKTHLVPFGEYLPLRSVLKAIGLRRLTQVRGSFSSGQTPRPLLAVSGLPLIAPLICYEAIFPNEIVQGTKRPGVLLNVTNDAWFGDTTGPRQHFHQARLRAVEQGLPLLRVANNGISGVVDPYGRLLHQLGLNTRGTLDVDLPAARATTFYARWGDALAFGCALLLCCFALFLALGRSVLGGRQ